MRRKEREVTDLKDIVSIIRQCDVCRLAFFDEEFPYIVPLNFAVIFEGEIPTLYFHGAAAGTKMELMVRNPKVGFELDRGHKLVTGSMACDYSMEYESVCGTGTLSLVEDIAEKQKIFTALMKQYDPGKSHEFNPKAVAATTILRLTVRSITGKRMKKF